MICSSMPIFTSSRRIMKRRSPHAYNNRAWILAERGEDERALEDCERSLRIGADLASASTQCARVYCWQGDYEQSLADCARALEITPDQASAYAVRGLIAHAP